MHTWGLEPPARLPKGGATSSCATGCRPRKSWNWKWDFTSSAEEWAERIAWYRSMMFEDQSVLADVAMEDDEIDAQFIQGTSP